MFLGRLPLFSVRPRRTKGSLSRNRDRIPDGWRRGFPPGRWRTLGWQRAAWTTIRHSTILALVYALFIEVLLGSVPGIVKRAAVNYYGRSIMYAAGEPEGLPPPDPRWFEPLGVETASWALVGITAGSLALAVLVFSRREYRDLT